VHWTHRCRAYDLARGVTGRSKSPAPLCEYRSPAAPTRGLSGMSEPAHRTTLFPHWTILALLLLLVSVAGLTWIRKRTIVVGSARNLPESRDWLSKWNFGLHTALTEAGLSLAPAKAIVQTPSARHDIGSTIRPILPRIVKQGVATEVEIDIDTRSATRRRTRGHERHLCRGREVLAPERENKNRSPPRRSRPMAWTPSARFFHQGSEEQLHGKADGRLDAIGCEAVGHIGQ
jgi:hypothetical protein